MYASVNRKSRGLSLLEVLIAFLILLIAVLTMVGYTATIHRAASESRNQALASMEARSLLERTRDFAPVFEAAAETGGYTETKTEYLLGDEESPEDNEEGRRAAMSFTMTSRTEHVAGDIYRIEVTATWEEQGRVRTVVLESRGVRPGY
jgi:Tfp pilus assembly protein PilV